jgi:hypothetical protein
MATVPRPDTAERPADAWRVDAAAPSFGRVVLMAAALLGIYLVLSSVNDPGGTLGADEGAKVATLRAMERSGSATPDVGYWAAAWDPDLVDHGLYGTVRVGGNDVAVTTLPMLVAARPLWDLGGYRAALLLPMLGGVATALAAAALARRLAGRERARRAGTAAFWLIGLASPVLLYALDLWEHTIGLAAMAWGTVLLVDAAGVLGADDDASSRRASTAWLALGAGACFGAAASMRSEAFVYAATTVALAAIASVAVDRPHGRRRAVTIAVAAAAGFVVLLLAGVLFEWWVLGGTIRAGRVVDTAAAGGSDLVGRIRAAVVTLVDPAPVVDGGYLLLGGAFVLAVAVLALAAAARIRPRAAWPAAAVVLVAIVIRVADGPGFVPGLLVAAPLAVVGLVLGWDRPAWWLVLMALVPVPLVLAFQFLGGALAQWGGRYLLPTGFLLGVVGVVRLVELPRRAAIGLGGLAVVVTALGLAYASQRTHAYAAAGRQLADRHEQVLISPDGFPPRELGATWGTKDWLASAPDGLAGAEAVAVRSGARTFAVVALDPDVVLPPVTGFHEVGRSQVPLLGGSQFTVVSYAAD